MRLLNFLTSRLHTLFYSAPIVPKVPYHSENSANQVVFSPQNTIQDMIKIRSLAHLDKVRLYNDRRRELSCGNIFILGEQVIISCMQDN